MIPLGFFLLVAGDVMFVYIFSGAKENKKRDPNRCQNRNRHPHHSHYLRRRCRRCRRRRCRRRGQK